MDNNCIELPTLRWEGRKGWKKEAACNGMDTRLFFRKKPTYELLERCKGCAVRLECLEYAIRNGLNNGIFGGFNAKERAEMTLEDIKV